jgi:hypothetical protein
MSVSYDFRITIAGGGSDAEINTPRSMPKLKKAFEDLGGENYEAIDESPHQFSVLFNGVSYESYHNFLQCLEDELERTKRSMALTLKIEFPPDDSVGEFRGFIYDRPGSRSRMIMSDLDYEGRPCMAIEDFETLSRNKWPAKLKERVQFLKDFKRFETRPIGTKLREQLNEIFFPR